MMMMMGKEGELKRGNNTVQSTKTTLYTSANPPQFYTPLDSIRCIEIPPYFLQKCTRIACLADRIYSYSLLHLQNKMIVAECYLNL